MLFGILWCDCLCWSVSIWLLEQMNKLLHDIRQVRILAPYQEGLRMQRRLHDGLADHAVVHVLDGCGIGGDRHTVAQETIDPAQLMEDAVSVFWQIMFGENPCWRQAFIIRSL